MTVVVGMKRLVTDRARTHAIHGMRQRASLIRAGVLSLPSQRPGEPDGDYLKRVAEERKT